MTETISFNLLDEPWIPCLDATGAAQEYSLRDTFARASELQEIYAESPLVTASLYRLCLAVLHSALRGPKDWRAWGKLWSANGFDMARLNKYFKEEEIHTRFDLFGKHPFYQADDKRVKPNYAFSLIVGSQASNPTLWDHRLEAGSVTLTAAQAARAVITAQTFGLCGLSGVPRVSFEDSIGARGILFLVQGNNLFETLMLNLVRYPPDQNVFPDQSSKDKPAWESNNPFKARDKPSGYLDYLTWQNRRILLLPELDGERIVVKKMKWAPDLKSSKDVRDFMQRRRKNEKPKKDDPAWLPLKFDPDRALWRQSVTLLDWRNPDIQRPYVCDWLAELSNEGYLDSARRYRLMAFGWGKDRANIAFQRGERMPLPLTFLRDEQRIGKLTLALTLAEQSGGALTGAVKLLAGELTAAKSAKKESSKPSDKKGKRKQESDGDGGKERKARDQLAASWNVGARYWGALETPFWVLVDLLARGDHDNAWDAARFEWRDKVRDAIRRAFALAEEYAGTNPRALKAAVLARTQLRMSLGRIMPKQENGKEKEV